MFDNSNSQYTHWTLDYLDNKRRSSVLCLTLDKANAKVNALDLPVLRELDAILDQLSAQQRSSRDDALIAGVIIQSGKSNGFIAGADINYFPQLNNQQAAYEFMLQGQQVFNKLADLPLPTVALIHGFCLGGGAELALACRYRIAIDGDDARVKIGFPEINLGLHPGFGGTVRLPKLLGPFNAFGLMLTGRSLSADEALAMGLIDRVADDKAAGLTRAIQCINAQPKPRCATFLQRLASKRLLRPYGVHYLSRQYINQLDPGNQLAFYAILSNWESLGLDNFSMALDMEARSIASLMMSEYSRERIVKFLR